MNCSLESGWAAVTFGIFTSLLRENLAAFGSSTAIVDGSKKLHLKDSGTKDPLRNSRLVFWLKVIEDLGTDHDESISQNASQYNSRVWFALASLMS